jgi:hypothetical protein
LHFRGIFSLLAIIAFFGPRFQDGFGLGQARQACLPQGEFVAHDQASGHLALSDAFAQGEQFVNLGAQVGLEGQQVLGAHRLALGGIGMALGAIEADVAQLQHPGELGQQQDLHEEILQLG